MQKICFSDLTEILTSLGEKLDEEETKEFMLLADLDGDGNGNSFFFFEI